MSVRDDVLDARLGSLVAGKYELLRVLGRGGSSAVFEARHRVTHASYAVKLLRSGSDRDDAARMVREARALARLDHPHIVRLIDCDEEPEGGVFIVQELLVGRTLRTVLDDELTLAPPCALEILGPVLDALAYAHAAGIVHRDVKPENIVLCAESDGKIRAKLIDFGLARDPGGDAALTRKGVAVGTPRYMSPEQAWGRDDVDARSDVWSIGVVLYECLAGNPPYEGVNDREVLSSIVARDPPDLHAAGVGVEAWLADAVMSAVTRSPEARCPSAAELSRRLRRSPETVPAALAALAGDLPRTRSETAPRRRWFTAAGVVLVAVVVLVAALLGSRGTPPVPAPVVVAAPVPAAVPAPTVVAAPVVAPVPAPVVAASQVRPPSRVIPPRRIPASRPVPPARGANAAPIVDEL